MARRRKSGSPRRTGGSPPRSRDAGAGHDPAEDEAREALLERTRAAKRRGAGPLLLPPDYLERTRALPVNLAILAPLFLVYLACRLWAGSGIETEAAAGVRTLFGLLGRRGVLIVSLCTCLALLAALLSRGRAARAN